MKKSLIITLVVIIIIAILAIAGFFAWQNNQTQTQTAGWKTYTDLQNDFEFKYPGDWIAQKNEQNVVRFLDIKNPSQENDERPITFYVADNSNPRMFSTAVLHKINGLSFMEAFNDADAVSYAHDFYLDISKNSSSKILVWFNSVKDPAFDYDNILEKMLSTLKFTTPGLNKMAGWKTYTNDKFNYSFGYPNSVVLNFPSEAGGTYLPATETSNPVDAWDNKDLIFSVGYSPNLSNISLDELSKTFALSKEDMTLIPAKVGNLDGYKVAFENKSKTKPESYFTAIISDFYFIEQNGQMFNLTVLKNNNIADQMFFTFKFTK